MIKPHLIFTKLGYPFIPNQKPDKNRIVFSKKSYEYSCNGTRKLFNNLWITDISPKKPIYQI